MGQSYREALAGVRRWILEKQCDFTACVNMQIVTDSETALRVLIETPRRMAELLVSGDADFAPYRWISFQVMDMQGNEHEMLLFCYFDSPRDSLNEILIQLNRGTAIVLEDIGT